MLFRSEEDRAEGNRTEMNRRASSYLGQRVGAAARGAVTPEEHLARVRDLRDALQDADEPTRQAARLRVQRAMQGLGVRLVCEVKAGERETLLMLPTGFFCRIRHDGSVIGRVDMAVLASRGVAPDEGQAAQTARLLTDVIDAMTELSGGEPREGSFEDDADQDLVAAVEIGRAHV